MKSPEKRYLTSLGRAAGGAIVFALPILLTMEMWAFGSSMSSLRLTLLVVVLFPGLVALSHFIGFEPTFDIKEDVLDALAAIAVGFLTSMCVLALITVIEPDTSWRTLIGTTVLQALPASIGALLAQSQLGGGSRTRKDAEEPRTHVGELFIMATGALFLAFNIAPTEEIVLIAYKMTTWHTVSLAALSVATMHAFVYSLEFRGQVGVPTGRTFADVFMRFTVAGYGVALLMSAYMLWTFGRFDGNAPADIVTATIVLAFPAAVGAAAARLIL